MTTPLPDPLIEAITASVVETYPVVTTDIVAAVLTQAAAAREIATGDPVDTVRRNPNGDIATRILNDGIPMWRISPADGSPQHYDMQPTLDWPKIFDPT